MRGRLIKRGVIMRKMIYIIIVLSLTFFTACSSPKLPADLPEINDQENTNIKVSDLIPFKENVKLIYEGYGNEFASQEVFFEYIDENMAQLKIINPGTNSIRILQKTSDQIKEVYYEGEFYHIEDMRSVKPIKDIIAIKEPVEVGNSWMVENSYKREITGVGVEIETPYDSFNAVEVTTTLDGGAKSINYYVEGIGLVATIYSANDGTQVKTLLSDITNGPMERDIVVFYPEDSQQFDTVFVNHKLLFNTNDSLESVFENIFKYPVKDGLIALISEDTVINSIRFERNTWRVEIDFSKELIPGWNVGSSLEAELLKSIVNTLGDFFDTDSVYITIDGKPYESGHIALKEGEEFIVNYNGIKEY